ncbi:MAG: hypothetical protein K2X01_09440 [Cyanobacteria bacterium]|nr:hypothetical protein [Cyanobacteriota bacterium]
MFFKKKATPSGEADSSESLQEDSEVKASGKKSGLSAKPRAASKGYLFGNQVGSEPAPVDFGFGSQYMPTESSPQTEASQIIEDSFNPSIEETLFIPEQAVAEQAVNTEPESWLAPELNQGIPVFEPEMPDLLPEKISEQYSEPYSEPTNSIMPEAFLAETTLEEPAPLLNQQPEMQQAEMPTFELEAMTESNLTQSEPLSPSIPEFPASGSFDDSETDDFMGLESPVLMDIPVMPAMPLPVNEPLVNEPLKHESINEPFTAAEPEVFPLDMTLGSGSLDIPDISQSKQWDVAGTLDNDIMPAPGLPSLDDQTGFSGSFGPELDNFGDPVVQNAVDDFWTHMAPGFDDAMSSLEPEQPLLNEPNILDMPQLSDDPNIIKQVQEQVASVLDADEIEDVMPYQGQAFYKPAEDPDFMGLPTFELPEMPLQWEENADGPELPNTGSGASQSSPAFADTVSHATVASFSSLDFAPAAELISLEAVTDDSEFLPEATYTEAITSYGLEPVASHAPSGEEPTGNLDMLRPLDDSFTDESWAFTQEMPILPPELDHPQNWVTETPEAEGPALELNSLQVNVSEADLEKLQLSQLTTPFQTQDGVQNTERQKAYDPTTAIGVSHTDSDGKNTHPNQYQLDDATLLMVTPMNGLWLLMAALSKQDDVTPDMTVLKVFSTDPLEDPEAEIKATKQRFGGETQLYLLQIGKWRAVIGRDPHKIELRSEVTD